jgi:hypothetical protein
MKAIQVLLAYSVAVLVIAFVCSPSAGGQVRPAYEVLNDKDSVVVIPSSFYFAGQSAPTQMRNAAAARIGKGRLVIAGMVDTSGYSTEISGKYEGFLITDSPILIGNKTLGTGAYGFGFSKKGTLNIFDLSSKQILSTQSKDDGEMKRPRPLQMISSGNGVRLYKGKSYIVIRPL